MQCDYHKIRTSRFLYLINFVFSRVEWSFSFLQYKINILLNPYFFMNKPCSIILIWHGGPVWTRKTSMQFAITKKIQIETSERQHCFQKQQEPHNQQFPNLRYKHYNKLVPQILWKQFHVVRQIHKIRQPTDKILPPTWVCGKWGLTEVFEHQEFFCTFVSADGNLLSICK